MTVEGLGTTGGGLHPVQERFTKAHASQCGFCTPGFVRDTTIDSLFTLFDPTPFLFFVKNVTPEEKIDDGDYAS